MTLSLAIIKDGIFTVSGVLTAKECLELIQRAEHLGFEPAAVRTTGGPQMIAAIRNNDRLLITDEELAAEMWRRVGPFLPQIEGMKARGVDHHLRVYRYQPGHRFKPHRDGIATNEIGQSSKLSFLIYLNDASDGGETIFRERAVSHSADGDRKIVVVPKTGSALLFRHHLWHESAPIIAGAKYVLRSDVFYEQ